MPLKIVRNDITRMETEAIVNTANTDPIVGPDCDYAIYQAAGREILLDYRKRYIGQVQEGEAFLTPGFGLKAKYIIHTVSPLFRDGMHGEEEKLRLCYRNSLKLARERGIQSIAFPLIATGSFGYPKEEGMRIAVDEINAFLLCESMTIYLVVFGRELSGLGKRLYANLESYIDQNYVDQKSKEEYEWDRGRERYSAPTWSPRDRYYDAPMQSPRDRYYDAPMPAPRDDCFSAPMQGPAENSFAAGKESRKQKKRILPEFSWAKKREEKKKTEEMEDAAPVLEAISFGEFEGFHENRLQERMMHLSDTFSQYLLYLIQSKNMENAEVYKRAIVDKKIFSKIKNNINYHPQKLTALCLCIGARLNMDETRDLLARAGYALSPCDKTDIIFSYFIENGIYDMIELDIQLEEHGLPCIIS